VRRVAHPTPFLNTAQHRASTPPQPRRRLVRPGHAPRRRWPCARRIAAADGARRAHASDRKSQLLARHGQNDSDIAIGRKNYLFLGSDEGGDRAATLYSLLGTARLNGVNPLAYLTHVLKVINDHKVNAIDALLPWRLKETEPSIRVAEATLIQASDRIH